MIFKKQMPRMNLTNVTIYPLGPHALSPPPASDMYIYIYIFFFSFLTANKHAIVTTSVLNIPEAASQATHATKETDLQLSRPQGSNASKFIGSIHKRLSFIAQGRKLLLLAIECFLFETARLDRCGQHADVRSDFL